MLFGYLSAIPLTLAEVVPEHLHVQAFSEKQYSLTINYHTYHKRLYPVLSELFAVLNTAMYGDILFI